jgi:amino acid permease
MLLKFKIIAAGVAVFLSGLGCLVSWLYGIYALLRFYHALYKANKTWRACLLKFLMALGVFMIFWAIAGSAILLLNHFIDSKNAAGVRPER